jgi:branched-subunit amino acid aminotransferase/4-amino-4-deoxychorismate lyase
LPPDPRQGVFETLLVEGGRAQALERHLARLSESVRTLYHTRLTLPPLALPNEPHRLRIDAFPDGSVTHEVTPLNIAALRGPVALQPVVVRDGLGSHKWRDRRWLESQPEVPLLVDANGSVLEAAWGNVWIIEGSRLVTPVADGRILPGITRELLLGLEPSAAAEPLSLERLAAADAVFLTSALRHAVAAGLGETPSVVPDEVERIRAALAAVAWD